MKEIAIKKWSELPTIWNELIDQNPIATPFQSYAFLSFTGKGKPQRKDLFRTLGLKELNLVLYADQAPVAIAPMLYQTKKGKTTVYFRGHFTAVNQLDLIYSSLSYDDFVLLMDGIRNRLGNVSFCLDWVYGKSPTSGYLKRYLSSAEILEIESFAIPIPKHYDDWFQGLHKSVRQTLRTTKNRLATDNVQWSVSYFFGEKIDSAVYRQMMAVYADRFLVKNNFRFGSLKHLVKKALQLYLLRDQMTRYLHNASESFHVIVYMNGEIAAFASGLLGKNKRALVSRLAMNTALKRYNPGAILLSSAVDYLAQQKLTGEIDVETLDLSQGGHGEMSYKSAYGGVMYYNYVFNG